MEIPLTITCVECGGPAHRRPDDPELGWEVDDLVTYVCRDCNHRMDIVLEEDDVHDEGEW